MSDNLVLDVLLETSSSINKLSSSFLEYLEKAKVESDKLIEGISTFEEYTQLDIENEYVRITDSKRYIVKFSDEFSTMRDLARQINDNLAIISEEISRMLENNDEEKHDSSDIRNLANEISAFIWFIDNFFISRNDIDIDTTAYDVRALSEVSSGLDLLNQHVRSFIFSTSLH